MAFAGDSIPCSYCGLPTTIATASAEGAAGKGFCCLGCRIASAIVHGEDESGANRWALTRLGLAIFFTMNVMVFTLVLWTWSVHELPSDSQVMAFREILRYACLLFSGPVLILLGGPLVESSIDAWRLRRFTTDMLLLLGVCAAFFYSVASLLLGYADVYFEVACMILVAVTLGKWLEATAKLKATQALRSLKQLLPATVRRIDSDGESTVPLERVRAGDRIRILPGERIPVDGKIETGCCSVEEQVLTGESIPRTVAKGDSVHGGTLNLDGSLTISATASPEEGAISRLVAAVEKATASNCRAVRLADRMAAWFVPVIFVACVSAYVVHSANGLQHGLMAALSVVLIACPCALGIATPLALWVAINTAARNGVLFRNGDAVLSLARIRSVGFDKTGTVTDGKVRLIEEYYDDPIRKSNRRIALLLASSSSHVLSAEIAQSLATKRITDGTDTRSIQLSDIRDCPGKGMTAVVNYVSVDGQLQRSCHATIGSVAFARERRLSVSLSMAREIDKQSDKAIVCAGWNGRVKCAFFLGEELRPESTNVFSQLRDLDLELAILTGDHRDRAAAVSQLTGVTAIGQLLPDEKLQALNKLPHPVAMVGDGINDSIAMAVAEVGISLDCGTDVSRDAVDVCLMGSTLKNLPWSISLARSAQKAVVRNLVWAVVYNAVGIGFAVAGKLSPIIAAIAMVGSSLFVLTNSLSFAARPLAEQSNENLDGRSQDQASIRPPNSTESSSEQTENENKNEYAIRSPHLVSEAQLMVGSRND